MKTLRTFFAVSFLVLGFGLLNNSSAQSIYFCEGVDSDGQPQSANTKFTIPKDGGYLYVLVRLPYDYNCSFADFEIYYNGVYDNTISMDTKENWTWFWKQITFLDSGEYVIDVYDCNDDLVVSGTLQIDVE